MLLGHEGVQSPTRELGRRRGITEVEISQPRFEVLLTRRNGVETVFHRGRELVVHQIRKVGTEQIDHSEGLKRGHQRFTLLPHVAPTIDGFHHGGVRRRPTNTKVF